MATQTRVPTANASTTNNNTWSSGGLNEKWDNVDEGVATHDSDSTFNYKIDTNGAQHFLFAAFAIDSSAIQQLDVVFVSRAAVGGCTLNGRLRVNAVNYANTTQAQTASYSTYTYTWATNPNTAAAWVEADIEGTGANPLTEIGAISTGLIAGEEARITALEGTVTYTESAAPVVLGSTLALVGVGV